MMLLLLLLASTCIVVVQGGGQAPNSELAHMSPSFFVEVINWEKKMSHSMMLSLPHMPSAFQPKSIFLCWLR